MKNNNFYTLITGASQGIGKAFAFECASKGMNLFLVALPDHHLHTVEKTIKERYEVQIITFSIDLTSPGAIRKVYEFALDNYIRVNFLINNAGFGTSGTFENSDYDLNLKMIQLNVQALVGMTHFFIPDLKNNAPAHILNMSSMEATLPLPYKAVYTGTKNFIYTFSLALREELKGTGVQVSVLCPGPVLTNEDGYKRIKSQGSKAKLMINMPENVVKKAIRDTSKGKSVIIPGFLPYIIIKISKFFPTNVKMKILERVFRVYKEDKTKDTEQMISGRL